MPIIDCPSRVPKRAGCEHGAAERTHEDVIAAPETTVRIAFKLPITPYSVPKGALLHPAAGLPSHTYLRLMRVRRDAERSSTSFLSASTNSIEQRWRLKFGLRSFSPGEAPGARCAGHIVPDPVP